MAVRGEVWQTRCRQSERMHLLMVYRFLGSSSQRGPVPAPRRWTARLQGPESERRWVEGQRSRGTPSEQNCWTCLGLNLYVPLGEENILINAELDKLSHMLLFKFSLMEGQIFGKYTGKTRLVCTGRACTFNLYAYLLRVCTILWF